MLDCILPILLGALICATVWLIFSIGRTLWADKRDDELVEEMQHCMDEQVKSIGELREKHNSLVKEVCRLADAVFAMQLSKKKKRTVKDK